MNKFISQYKKNIISEIKDSYRNIDIKFINLDNIKNYLYLENESLLHNSVCFLNKEFIKSIKHSSSLIEIGCGSDSLILSTENKFIVKKDALDLHEYNFRGEKTLNNLLGSVEFLPLRSNQYDYCISNQSIEHWHEFGVPLSKGISEITRVLKINSGKLIINFPLFLHGKREFVNGNLKYIVSVISRYLRVCSINIIYSNKNNYYGWKLCGQPPSRVKSYIKSKGIHAMPNSFVCEITAIKEIDIRRKIQKRNFSFKRIINLYKDYSFYELLYKLVKKLKKESE